MLNDTLSASLSKIKNYEKISRKEVVIETVSNELKKVLEILQDSLYVGSFEEITDKKGGVLKLNLIGHINQVGTIKPRFAVGKADFEKYEKRYLPAKDFGIIIVSTSQGMMTHIEAKKKGIGGKLIAYCY